MDKLNKFKQEIINKKTFTESDIKYLTSLSQENLFEITESLNFSQKQAIYQSLCTPKVPDWIDKTVQIHNSSLDLKSNLPVIKEKQDFKKIVKMIMISAGDFNPPLNETVTKMYSFIKNYLKELKKLSKKSLENKFSEIKNKYMNNSKKIVAFTEDDEENEENLDETNEKLENKGNEVMKNVERLNFNDERTAKMNEEEYFFFTECRKANFLKFGKEKFLKWINAKHSPKLYSWIAREKIFEIIENANKRRHEDFKLSFLTSPITAEELFID